MNPERPFWTTRRVVVCLATVALLVGVALFACPVHASLRTSSGTRQLACGTVVAPETARLRAEARQIAADRDGRALAAVASGMPMPVDLFAQADVYAQADTCERAVYARAAVAALLLLAGFLVAIPLLLRRPR